MKHVIPPPVPPWFFLIIAGLWLGVAWADEVVMTSGERFSTDKVWEEGDAIRFTMQGLLVRVDKKEVATIIRSSDVPPPPGPRPAAAPQNPSPKISTAPSAVPSAPTPMATPLWKGPPVDGGPAQGPPNRPSPSRKEDHKGIGMEGITWGMPTKHLPGCKKIKTDPAYGGIDQYYVPDQPLHFAGAPLDGLVYGFWQDQLYSIMMWADGRIGYERLRDGLFSMYGRGIQRKPEIERFVWDEPATQRMLEFDGQLKTGIFIMRSSELDTLIKERHPVSPDP